LEMIACRLNRDCRGTIGREEEPAGRNSGKGYGRQAVVVRKLERAAVAAGQEIVFANIAALPHRAHGVDDVARGQLVAHGDLRIARLAAIEGAAGDRKFGTSRSMNGTVDSAAAEQRTVGGIDDGINLQLGDVAHMHSEPAHSGMFPCFFSGTLCFLFLSVLNARATRRLVPCGMMTSSMKPRSAATKGLAKRAS